jgi:hypothetical protein
VLWNSTRSVSSYCTLTPYTLVFYSLLIVNTNSQIVSGKGRLAMSVLHLLIGAVVAYASLSRG